MHPRSNATLTVPPRREPLYGCWYYLNHRPWLPSPQRGILRCPLFEIWMAALQPALSCICWASFTVDHAMICYKRGFPTIKHNEIHDSLLNEVYHKVGIEPSLQPLSGKSLDYCTVNKPELIFMQEASGTRRRTPFWCKGVPPKCSFIPFQRSCIHLWEAWIRQEKRVRPMSSWGWVWCVHPTRFFDVQRDGQVMHHLVPSILAEKPQEHF